MRLASRFVLFLSLCFLVTACDTLFGVIEDGNHVYGRVVDSKGKPIPDVAVAINGHLSTTNKNGCFTDESLEKPFYIQITKNEYGYLSKEIDYRTSKVIVVLKRIDEHLPSEISVEAQDINYVDDCDCN